jgi:hypothetical protein
MTQDVEHAYGWSSQRLCDSNRLRGVEGYRVTVSPAEANVCFLVAVERMTRATEVRGRIVGPRSLYAELPQVASPLRSVRARLDAEEVLMARTAFPNPRTWQPSAPLLYRVVVELWQDGQLCEAAGFDLGFRAIELISGKVSVNQTRLSLQGMPCLPESREEAAARRQTGYNLVVAGPGQWHWWVRANPMGFLLLERVALSTLTPHYVGLLSQQPCFLGFIVDRELLDRPPSETESFLRTWRERHVFIGLEFDGPPPPTVPDGLSFLVCRESELPGLGPSSLPRLVLRDPKAREITPTRAPDGVLGWHDG